VSQKGRGKCDVAAGVGGGGRGKSAMGAGGSYGGILATWMRLKVKT
jgi:hypothetical protein